MFLEGGTEKCCPFLYALTTTTMQLTISDEVDYYYIKTVADFDEALTFLRGAISSTTLVACDTEVRVLHEEFPGRASWADPHTSRVATFQIFVEGTLHPFIFDVLHLGADQTRPLIDLLNNKAIRKLFHNAKYDLSVIRSTWGVWLPNTWCTMLMSQRIGVCTGFRASRLRGHSYKAVARDYFGIDLSKAEQSSDWGNPNRSDSQLAYAAMDVVAPKGHAIDSILLEAYRTFHTVLYSEGPSGFGGHCRVKGFKEPIELDQAANLVLAKIQFNGMPVSEALLTAIYHTAGAEATELKIYLCKSFNLPIKTNLVYTERGPEIEVSLYEKTEKALNNPKTLVQLVNAALESQDDLPRIDDAKAESLEKVLKALQVKLRVEEDSAEEKPEEDGRGDDSDADSEDEVSDVSWGNDLIAKLIKYKELSKLISIDYRKLINPVTGRVHSSYWCIGAGTGRMASGGKDSFNCQNISTKHVKIQYKLNSNPYSKDFTVEKDKLVTEDVTLRNAFVNQDPGMLFCSGDFAAQELRIAAALSRDAAMASVYKREMEYLNGTRPLPVNPTTGETYADPQCCLHIMAATTLDPEVKRLVAEEPWLALPSNPVVAASRKKAKPLSYALIYGAQSGTIAKTTGTTKDDAQVSMDKYFSKPDGFWGLAGWLRATSMLGSDLRWVRLITGELIMVSESNSKGSSDGDSTGRKACNASIQGLASTQAKLALVWADAKFEELDKQYEEQLHGRKAELIAIVHDEIDALVPGGGDFSLVPDERANAKANVDHFYKPKFSMKANVNAEQAMGIVYSEALKKCMEEAMKHTFDLIDSSVPAGSSVATSYYWVH